MGTLTVSEKKAIRPFRLEIPEEELVDLRRRIAATRWPEKETVGDQSQGVQLATTQALARYWETEYDSRKVEARLNDLQITAAIVRESVGRGLRHTKEIIP